MADITRVEFKAMCDESLKGLTRPILPIVVRADPDDPNQIIIENFPQPPEYILRAVVGRKP